MRTTIPLFHAEQRADFQVLPGLGHDPLVRGYHQQHQVHAADSGDHGPDETLVAGDVNDPEAQVPRQFQVGEAELDGNAARLLLLQAVRVDAGQRLHQRGLAVIDMPGGAENQMLHV